MSSIVQERYTLFLIRLGFILTHSLLLSLIKLIYAGRVPAIIHKPRLRACVCAEPVCVSIVRVFQSARVCVCTCKGAVLGAEVTPELECQVFQGIEAVQLYETSAYVG